MRAYLAAFDAWMLARRDGDGLEIRDAARAKGLALMVMEDAAL